MSLPPRQFWRSFNTLKMGTKLGIGCGFAFSLLIVLVFFATMSGIAIATAFPITVTPSHNATTGSAPTQVANVSQATPTSQVVRITPTSTPRPKPTATPTTAPTDTPQPVPTQVPTTAPTQPPPPTATPAPQPTSPPTGVNGNPWGYNFVPGNAITSPPATFCNYFACIANFWNGNGYVEECQDTMYSLSGGIRGECSHHGGKLQELYSH